MWRLTHNERHGQELYGKLFPRKTWARALDGMASCDREYSYDPCVKRGEAQDSGATVMVQ